MNRALLVTLFLAVTNTQAAERLADFATHLPIDVPSGAALVRLTLPPAAYAGLHGPGLDELRIFNGAGEALPVARLPARRTEDTLRGRAPLLPLPDAAAAPADTRLQIRRGPDGALVHIEVEQRTQTPPKHEAPPMAYVADLAGFPHPLTALVVEPAGGADFSSQVRLDSSDDLARWRTERSSEPLMVVGQAGQRIERLRIGLSGLRARYLRLTWTGTAPVRLVALDLEHEKSPEAARSWLTLAPQAGEQPGTWRYVSPGLMPVDRLRVEAADPNTVAAVRVASRGASRDTWQSAGAFTAYRLRQAEGEIASGEFAVPTRRDPLWELSLQPPPGSGPKLALGWVPESLVFAARGAPPFVLAVGQARLSGAWLPVESLVPGWGT
ncbi:MAG: DUF3999 family protein, partial [Zoogloeaceae bacterium]|nr:DUF3999 family protein [Zoogloeaceae bacterium]